MLRSFSWAVYITPSNQSFYNKWISFITLPVCNPHKLIKLPFHNTRVHVLMNRNWQVSLLDGIVRQSTIWIQNMNPGWRIFHFECMIVIRRVGCTKMNSVKTLIESHWQQMEEIRAYKSRFYALNFLRKLRRYFGAEYIFVLQWFCSE